MKWILFPALMTLFIGIVYFFNYEKESVRIEDWTTFEKSGKKIKTHQTTKEEKIKINVPLNIDNKRIVKSTSSSQFNSKKLKGRTVLGLKGDKISNDLQLEYKNEINKDWKYLLGQKVLSDLQDDTQIYIKKVDSVINIEGIKATYMEIVIIKFLDSKGNQTSFRALVDSSNGKVIRRWDRTIIEDFKKSKKGLIPSGTLKDLSESKDSP